MRSKDEFGGYTPSRVKGGAMGVRANLILIGTNRLCPHRSEPQQEQTEPS